MNSEINLDSFLVKAKSYNSDHWFFGFFEKDIIALESIYRISKVDYRNFTRLKYQERIELSTLCRCSGKKDLKNNLVYENDIVRYKINNELGYIEGVVVFDDSFMRWYMKNDTHGQIDIFFEYDSSKVLVIGNIFNDEVSKSEF